MSTFWGIERTTGRWRRNSTSLSSVFTACLAVWTRMPGWTFRAATEPTPNSGGFRLADEEAKGRPRGRGVGRACMQFRASRGRAALAVWQEPGRLLQSRLTGETSDFDTRSAQAPSAGRCLFGSGSVSVGGDFAMKALSRGPPGNSHGGGWSDSGDHAVPLETRDTAGVRIFL